MDRLGGMQNPMQNPHEVEQNVLLERIIKNADKCNEAIAELNHSFKEFTYANRMVKATSKLVNNYNDTSRAYMTTTKMMPQPK